jgi:hypothetical protein
MENLIENQNENEIRGFVREFFIPAESSGTRTQHQLTEYLLQNYGKLDRNKGLPISKLIEQLNIDGPRQVCQYQFKKNDIVW